MFWVQKIFFFAFLNSSSVQLSIFCEKILDKKYLLKINNVFLTSSKRLVETPPICLVLCLSYAPLSV